MGSETYSIAQLIPELPALGRRPEITEAIEATEKSHSPKAKLEIHPESSRMGQSHYTTLLKHQRRRGKVKKRSPRKQTRL
jgi:hypothetical protein